MLNIDDVINRLIEHPAKELYYSISEGKFLDRKVSGDEYEENDDLCCFCGAKKCWDTARKTFAGKHPEVFKEALPTCKVATWNSLVKEANLEKEWFLELRLALSENVTRFAGLFGIIEIEAEPELYREIKKELLLFEVKHYEKKYSDMVYFQLGADYEAVPMTILGNAGNVFGISFYPSDRYGDNFLLVQNQDRLRIDPGTANSISYMLSFYFEKDPSEFDYLKDVFESHNHITSAYMCYGTLMRSYLPKSLAIRALNYLQSVNREMPRFVKTKQSKIKDDCFYSIILDDGKFLVHEMDPYKSFNGCLPYDFDNMSFCEAPLKFKNRNAWDATVRYLPGIASPAEGEERIINLTFVAILCDHDSGYVHIHKLGQAKNFNPFDNLADGLSEELQKTTLPKTIYVNNYFDVLFFNSYFEFLIEKGKIKIELVPQELKSDIAFDSLTDYVQNGMDEDDFSGKKVAEA